MVGWGYLGDWAVWVVGVFGLGYFSFWFGELGWFSYLEGCLGGYWLGLVYDRKFYCKKCMTQQLLVTLCMTQNMGAIFL